MMIIIWISIFYGMPILFLHQAYGFANLDASVISISAFRALPSLLTLGHLFMIDMVIKGIALTMLTSFVLMLSVKLKHSMTTLLICLCGFVVPIFLFYNHIDILESFSLYPMLSSLQYALNQPLLLMIQIIVSISIIVISLKIVFRDYFVSK